MKRPFWKRLVFDSNIWLSMGGAFLGAYLFSIVHKYLDLQVLFGLFLYFMTSYGLHSYTSTYLNKASYGEIEDFSKSGFFKVLMSLCIVLWGALLWESKGGLLLLFVASLVTPLYSYWRISSGETIRSFKLHIQRFKSVMTVFVLMTVMVYCSGMNAFLYLEIMSLLFLHLLINTLSGDLRDIESDKELKKDSLAVLYGFKMTKQILEFISVTGVILSYFLTDSLTWSLVFSLNFILLRRLKIFSKPDAYHLIDVVHFVPLISLFL